MAGRITPVTRFLVLLTIVHRDLSPPPKITAVVRRGIDTEANSPDSATSNDQPQLGAAPQSITKQIGELVARPCYAFMQRRRSVQHADAVQAPLGHADRMRDAFSPNLLTVDGHGDRADILSLEFPVEWPAAPAYVRRVSTVVDNYFPARDIKDHVSVRIRRSDTFGKGLNDEKSHPVWWAEVTTNGPVKRSPVFAKCP
jgi:hypothetical protein